MNYIKHLFYIWEPWKWKFIDWCRITLACWGPVILSRLVISHFPLSSFLWWKVKKKGGGAISRRKLLYGNLASFHKNSIALLFSDLWYEIVSPNWVSAAVHKTPAPLRQADMKSCCACTLGTGRQEVPQCPVESGKAGPLKGKGIVSVRRREFQRKGVDSVGSWQPWSTTSRGGL